MHTFMSAAPAQVASKEVGQATPTFRGILGQLLAQEGAGGLVRGVFPRMFNSALWGTAMMSTYEFLKRTCQVPVEEAVAEAAHSL